jgi:hypothetical protein
MAQRRIDAGQGIVGVGAVAQPVCRVRRHVQREDAQDMPFAPRDGQLIRYGTVAPFLILRGPPRKPGLTGAGVAVIRPRATERPQGPPPSAQVSFRSTERPL